MKVVYVLSPSARIVSRPDGLGFRLRIEQDNGIHGPEVYCADPDVTADVWARRLYAIQDARPTGREPSELAVVVGATLVGAVASFCSIPALLWVAVLLLR